ncbi:HCL325Cp [Eremothecium sinecaudum]|uniref:HCL325Cp n=1 Tax=Eremothecium sinecaudum TaxID=45286 RepID=A0A109UYF2_9SACH|nr:HCL325Cp [Eremothecium sinecaudum]AMD19826.1 HCL325Cp [Eremothecium sinecaudum]
MSEKHQVSNGAATIGASPGQRHASIVEMLSTPPPPANVLGGWTPLVEEQQANSQHHQQSNQQNQQLKYNYLSATSSQERLRSRQNSISSSESQVSSTTACLTNIHVQWQNIELSQLVEQNKLVYVNAEVSVEEAFNKLVEHNLTSVPVERFPGDMECVTFDYNDLNSYLLLVLGKISVDDVEVTKKCQSGQPVPVGRIVMLTPKNPFHKVPENENLSTVMGILGSGVHRVAITDPQGTTVRGILSQRRLVRYLWDNARLFSNLDTLLNSSLQCLGIGVLDRHMPPTSRQSRVISVLDHEPLVMALYKMHKERISSIAVINSQGMLLGNISVADVRHVTHTSQYPLLHNTCRHFISVILNNRGLEMGKDSFPIFHVYPTSSLARTIAKLVATKAHRLWIVQPAEQTLPTPLSASSSGEALEFSPRNIAPASGTSPVLAAQVGSLEPEFGKGYLVGVVSLTDILSLLARKHTENKQVDPLSARRQRGIPR